MPCHVHPTGRPRITQKVQLTPLLTLPRLRDFLLSPALLIPTPSPSSPRLQPACPGKDSGQGIVDSGACNPPRITGQVPPSPTHVNGHRSAFSLFCAERQLRRLAGHLSLWTRACLVAKRNAATRAHPGSECAVVLLIVPLGSGGRRHSSAADPHTACGGPMVPRCLRLRLRQLSAIRRREHGQHLNIDALQQSAVTALRSVSQSPTSKCNRRLGDQSSRAHTHTHPPPPSGDL